MRYFYILLLFACLGTFQNLQAQTCNDPNAHNAGEEGPCETCFDFIQNGDEEGVDCGGSNPNCPDCPVAVKLNVAGNARISGILELAPPGTANLFLGKGAGFSNTLGNNNTFIGWESGYLNVEGRFNTFIGENTGRNNIGGNNTFVGSKAGRDNTTGNSNTFVGKSAGIVNVEGVNNTFIGRNAGFANIDGNANTFVGRSSGLANSSGGANTFVGASAGESNTTGLENTFLGQQAGLMNVEGSNNTFLGEDAGRNTTASANTFVGSKAGVSNITGFNNTFVGRSAGFYNNRSGLVGIGDSALYNNGVGAIFTGDAIHNTAVGSKAGYANTTGASNTFVGSRAGSANTSGNYNTFIGSRAGGRNSTGFFNTFLGGFAGEFNTTGSSNTFVGLSAGDLNTTGVGNTFVGMDAGGGNTTGFSNTFVGKYAGITNQTGDNLEAFGYQATANLISSTPINNAFIIGSHGLMTSSHSGTLGNITVQKLTGYVNFGTASDGRMKKQIREDVQGLDFILALRPVSYQVDALKLDQFLRQGMEEVRAGKDDQSAEEKAKARERQATYEGYLRAKSAIRYTGFIAQEVEKAMTESGFEFSGLVKPAHDQDHYSLRYAEFVVPLVKGMQEQQEVIEDLREENKEQQKQIDELKNLVQQLLAQQPNQTPVQELDLNRPAGLSQNHPNPFHEKTVINYFLPDGTEKARLDVYSVDGKLLTTLPLQQHGAGQVQLKAGSFPAGTYLYSLIVGNEVLDTKRMVLTK